MTKPQNVTSPQNIVIEEEVVVSEVVQGEMDPTTMPVPGSQTEETAMTTTQAADQVPDQTPAHAQPPAQARGNAMDFFSEAGTKKQWFNVATPLEALQVIAAMDDTDFKLGDCRGQIIDCVQIVAHESEFENKEHELIAAVRTVIIDSQGKSYGSVAQGVRDSVASLFAMIGFPPYNPPIKLTPVEKTTRAGFKTLKLIPVVGKLPVID